jgi:dTDP-4-amino-4,6-dideoxygalactose transaminase
MSFPFINLAAQYQELKNEIDEKVRVVFETGRYIMGDEVTALEREIASYCAVAEGVGVDSGTRALELIWRALDIRPGDEIITTPFTFFATTSSILSVGAVPVFADIDPETLNINPESVAKKITPKTRAILVVHIFGLMADMPRILAAAGGIPVIEDACQALGASLNGKKAGAWGRASAFSFFPTKNLGGAGDGGMVVTNDAALADRVRILRNHGSRRLSEHEEVGCTARLDALQAAVLRVKLPHLDRWNALRAANAAVYNAAFCGASATTEQGRENAAEQTPQGRKLDVEKMRQGPAAAPSAGKNFTLQKTPEGYVHTWHQYALRAQNREQLLAQMAEAGIPHAIYYPIPAYLQAACRHLNLVAGLCPETERAVREVFSLPVCPWLAPENRARVIDALIARQG